jgi:hypothetical protein
MQFSSFSSSGSCYTAAAAHVPEPDLSTLVSSGTDRLMLRNIVYAAWSIFNYSSGSSSSSKVERNTCSYVKWNVERIADGRGYLLLIEFGRGFRIGLYDMQVLTLTLL